jgi:legumain
MLRNLGLAVAFCCGRTPLAADNQNEWAVIAVGSSSFMNYRHQADGCHAYQLLRQRGIPADQIILMMQDDVANAQENPFPGKLFNKPGSNPPDVYEGCNVDYKGSIVTAKLFLSVITGDESGVPANGKVLKSTSSSRVFLNFVDHGGVNIIAFPNGPTLHNTELSQALKTMQSKNMFSELLFYMEACESGSMFPDLATDSKIFAVTAANAKESSWGFYCGSDAKVNGKNINSCLGDLFSISWMEDSDLGDLSETIKTQVERVTARTNKSHVMTFGDKSFEDEPFSNFELRSRASLESVAPLFPLSENGAWDVRDIPLQTAYYQWESEKDDWRKQAAFAKLERVLAGRREDEKLFTKVAESVCHGQGYGCSYSLQKQRHDSKDLACHYDLVNIVHEVCPKRAEHNPGGWNAFNMKFSQMLVNICEKRSDFNHHMDSLKQIMQTECSVSASSWQAMTASSTSSDLVV